MRLAAGYPGLNFSGNARELSSLTFLTAGTGERERRGRKGREGKRCDELTKSELVTCDEFTVVAALSVNSFKKRLDNHMADMDNS